MCLLVPQALPLSPVGLLAGFTPLLPGVSTGLGPEVRIREVQGPPAGGSREGRTGAFGLGPGVDGPRTAGPDSSPCPRRPRPTAHFQVLPLVRPVAGSFCSNVLPFSSLMSLVLSSFTPGRRPCPPRAPARGPSPECVDSSLVRGSVRGYRRRGPKPAGRGPRPAPGALGPRPGPGRGRGRGGAGAGWMASASCERPPRAPEGSEWTPSTRSSLGSLPRPAPKGAGALAALDWVSTGPERRTRFHSQAFSWSQTRAHWGPVTVGTLVFGSPPVATEESRTASRRRVMHLRLQLTTY